MIWFKEQEEIFIIPSVVQAIGVVNVGHVGHVSADIENLILFDV